MKQEYSAGAIIWRKNNEEIQYLLIQSQPYKQFKSAWAFSKGHLEAGASVISVSAVSMMLLSNARGPDASTPGPLTPQAPNDGSPELSELPLIMPGIHRRRDALPIVASANSSGWPCAGSRGSTYRAMPMYRP